MAGTIQCPYCDVVLAYRTATPPRSIRCSKCKKSFLAEEVLTSAASFRAQTLYGPEQEVEGQKLKEQPVSQLPKAHTPRAVDVAIGMMVIGFFGWLLFSSNLAIDSASTTLIMVGAYFFVALIPGWIAYHKPRYKDVRNLGLVGLIIWPCWIIAFIWAFMTPGVREQ